MALHTLIALTAVVAGGAQDPSMDFQIATPVLTDTEIVAPQQSTVAVAQSSKVTTQFRNAKASEVLEWIEKRGINFIVNDGDIKPDAKVTLSVTDVPVENVLDALASALGGHWEMRNNIRVFHKGQGFATYFPATGVQGLKAMPVPPMSMTVPPNAFMKLDGKAFDKDFEKRMKEMGAEMEKRFGPEFHKKLEESLKDVRVYTLDEDNKLRQLQGKEREEAMKRAELDRKEAMKEAEVARKEALQNAEKYRKEAMKEAEIARKHATEARKEAMKDAERARAEGQRIREEVLRNYRGDRDVQTRIYRTAPSNRDGRRTFITPSFPVDGMDMGKFLKSLSSSQRDTQEKRGFIRYDDLTREQKRLLGVRPEGKFEIRLKVNQEEVVVRGE